MADTISLTFLGGVNEVGGNIVLLEDFELDVKLFIDFGIKIGNFYEQYERGEHPASIEELIHLRLIPNEEHIQIHNLYTNVWSGIELKNSTKITEDIKDNRTIDDLNPSNLDGILISHPHKDHFFGLSFVNRTIPIYTGAVTKKIIKAFFKSSKAGIDNNFAGLNWKTFRTGDILDIKGMKVVPYHVDHSIPAAYGFIIYTSAGPVVYTGDFRMHGPLSKMTEEFMQEVKTHETYLSYLSDNNLTEERRILASKGVKVLICEGTKIHKGIVESEQAVEDNLNQLFENNPFDFILTKYDRIDWDRFRTFSHIAKKYGWKYIITEKDAYFYFLLNRDAIHETMKDPDILQDEHIYILKRGQVKYDWQEKIRQVVYKHDQGHRFLNYQELKQMESQFLVYITHLSPILMNHLNFDKNGLFISSTVDPYAEEFFDNTKTIKCKLEQFGIPAYRIHASGHATPHDIINFIQDVKPETLIPIHTEHPEFFEMIFRNSDIEVKLPEKNVPITL